MLYYVLAGHGIFIIGSFITALSFYIIREGLTEDEQRRPPFKKVLWFPVNYYFFSLIAFPLIVFYTLAWLGGYRGDMMKKYWQWFESFII